MSSSRPDTAATKRDVDSEENRYIFTRAEEATTYDNLLWDGRISNADVRGDNDYSGLHMIPGIGIDNKDIDTDILLYYLLTCDPPADVNGRNRWGCTPMVRAVYCNNTSAVKVLIDFGGDRTIKSTTFLNSNTTPLDIAKKYIYWSNLPLLDVQENNIYMIKLLTECFPSEE